MLAVSNSLLPWDDAAAYSVSFNKVTGVEKG